MRTVLFHRDFQGFTGGHLKVWNYFNHVEAAAEHRAEIFFSPGSRWDAQNPWRHRRAETLAAWQPERADVLFLGGRDWEMIPAAERDRYRRPIINLIQHVRHGDPRDPLSGFLRHRAIRVCVSAEVQAAIERGGANGPSVVIPNGIDAPATPVTARAGRPVDWLICGHKDDRPAMARELARRLSEDRGWGAVRTLTKLLPREEFRAALAEAQNVVLLPRATEGFYLPALEAMAAGALVVCPDCVGNRTFCRDGDTAWVPTTGDVEAILTTMRAARASPREQEAVAARGQLAAAAYTLEAERAAFHQLLARVPALW